MKTKYESFLTLHIFVDHLVANLQYTDSEGQTIMHVVVREWCTDLTLFLLHYGAEIDVPDKYGRTPLFVAAAVNYKEMVRWLLDYGGKFCVFFSSSFGYRFYYRPGHKYLTVYFSLLYFSLLLIRLK